MWFGRAEASAEGNAGRAGALAIRRSSLAIAFYAILVHGWVVLNSGVFLDGRLYRELQIKGDLSSLLDIFNESGKPATGYLHVLLGLAPLPTVLTYKIIALCSIVAAALLVKLIAEQSRVFTTAETLFLSAFVTCYSAFQTYVEISVIPYVLYYSVFLGAVHLLQTAASDNESSRPDRYIAAWLMFFVSFQLASLVFVYIAALFVVASADPLFRRWRSSLVCVGLARRYGAFIALPFVFGIVREALWTPYGMYAGYNKPIGSLTSLIRSLAEFCVNAVSAQFARCAAAIANHPEIGAVLALTLAIGLRFALRDVTSSSRRARGGHPRHIGASQLAVFAGGLLFLVMFPYAVVGKPAAASGWESRHALLVGLPVGLGLLACARGFCTVLPRAGAFVVPLAGYAMIAGFTLASWSIHLDWYVRWIKDDATITELKRTPAGEIADVSYIYIDDQDDPSGRNYTFIDYLGMFNSAWGDEKRFGIPAAHGVDLAKLTRQLPLRRYLIREFDPSGCSSGLLIKFNPRSISRRELAWSHFRARVGGQPAAAPGLIELTWDRLSARRIGDVAAIRDAFEAYKAANGAFPADADARKGQPSTYIGRPGIAGARTWVEDLAPPYLDAIPMEPRTLDAEGRHYLIFSDGTDFKVIAHGPEDVACVQARRPEMSDPRRPLHAYGFWTAGAANW